MKLTARAWVVASALGLTWQPGPPGRAADCTNTTVGLTPLDDLETGLYLSLFQGGLYPGGSNLVPAGHEAEGLTRAAAVQPLDALGNPSPGGKIVLLSIGMSNTTQEFCGSSNLAQPCASWTFAGQAAVDPLVNHATLVIVNGAMGGQTAMTWDSPTDPNYDRVRDTLLVPQGLSEAQVQAAWVKVADASPNVSLPAANADAYNLETLTGGVVRALKGRYPNIKVAFLSSRIYGGYASTALNPEPYAYESGLSMKWLIEAQISQMAGGVIDPRAGDLNYDAVAPWLAWGPYLWADGLAPRSDGLTWECGNLETDGTHPSMSGEEKVGTMLLEFMLTSPFSAPWFRSGVGPTGDGDCDNDGDVDLADYASFADCVGGPGIASGAACTCADFNGDADGDLGDFAAFQAAFTGASPVMDPAFDDFERAELGGNWRVISGVVGIVDASDLGVLAAGAGIAAWQGSAFGADQFSAGVLSSTWNPANNLEVSVRMSPANGARYAFRRAGNGALSLRYESGGAPAVLASADGSAMAPGDTIRIEVQGTTLRGQINGIVLLTASDSNLTGGTAGVTFLAAAGVPAAYFESWTGGRLP